jgi:hypothetical protein
MLQAWICASTAAWRKYKRPARWTRQMLRGKWVCHAANVFAAVVLIVEERVSPLTLTSRLCIVRPRVRKPSGSGDSPWQIDAFEHLTAPGRWRREQKSSENFLHRTWQLSPLLNELLTRLREKDYLSEIQSPLRPIQSRPFANHSCASSQSRFLPNILLRQRARSR